MNWLKSSTKKSTTFNTEYFSQIKKDDIISTFICNQCVNSIIELYKFRQKCQIANDFLSAKSRIFIPKYKPKQQTPNKINMVPPDEPTTESTDVIEIDDDYDDNLNGFDENYSQSSSQQLNETYYNGSQAGSYCEADEDTGEVVGESMNCGWMGYESDEHDNDDNKSDEMLYAVTETSSLVKIKEEVEQKPPPSRTFECMYCGETFPSKWKQSIHMCPKKPKYKTGARGYTKKTIRKYTPQIMANAMKEVAEGAESIYRIAQKYGIPKNTLIYRAQKAGCYHPPSAT